ncbi:MAG: HRDC domain-containing protein [Wenzhouxiangellaceae bacterium]|nr:HRDC domain-containing protein [Wenzhouxiangellaceae bacterium]
MPAPTVHLVDTSEALLQHAPELAAADALGVDTEFVRERTWHPNPGLLQFSDGKHVWLVDPVMIDAEPLSATIGELLQQPTTCKILHSVGEDLEVFDRIAGVLPEPLFDTQRAAALLGHPLQLRYEDLARELLAIELPGGLGRNDWLRRPLPQAWLDYAADDVIALPAMRERMLEGLDRLGRREWLEEDCRRLLRRWQQEADPVERIRGAAGLNDAELERLTRMAQWRDQTARARNLPRGFVVPDPALLAAARLRPDDAALETRLAAIEKMPRRQLAVLTELIRATPRPFQRPPTLAPLTPDQRAQIKHLQNTVRAAGEQLGVEPTLIASKRDLTRLVQTGSCDWLNGWRGELLGDSFGTGSKASE